MRFNGIKKLTFIIAALAFSSHANALVTFGLKGGLGVNKLSVKDTSGTETAGTGFGIGYQGGISADFGAGFVTVGADVLYAQRGQFLILANSTWNEILVPVQAKINLLPFFYLGAGGYYSMAIGDITTKDANGNTLATTSFEDGNLSKGDFGAVASLGISIPLGVTSLSLEARYLYGLKNRLSNASGDAGATSSAVDILAGITF